MCAPPPGAKGKTKAKQRYLKSKKERRKARKAAGPKPFGEGKKKRAKSTGDTDERAKRAKLDVTEGATTSQDTRGPRSERKDESIEHEASRADATGPAPLSGLSGTEVSQAPQDSDSSNESDASSDSDNDNEGQDVGTDVRDAADENAIDSRPSRDDEALDAMTVDADPLQPPGEDANAEDMPGSPQYLYRFPQPQQVTDVDTQQLAAQGIPEALARPTDVSVTLTQALDTHGEAGVKLSPRIQQQLERLGITEWFAVQAAVIPVMLRDADLYRPYDPPRDICVSAPTGSGKTLAYTVPIVETLQSRMTVQLRALIMVPTRDLAVQVRDMFDAIGKGSGLRVAMITGSHSFKHEQRQLVHGQGDTARSQVDVLIATPGRLVDHVRGTPGFTLEHLRFLVIDEADRLLGQSFQQWVETLLDALAPAPHAGLSTLPSLYLGADEQPWLRDDLSVPHSSVQKLLFSATLTRDPAKMGALQLRRPHFIRVRDTALDDDATQERFTLPVGLAQHMMVTPSSEKVLRLLHLLHKDDEPVRHALCFTKSVEAAGRLVDLLCFFETAWAQASGAAPLQVRLYSSDLSTSERKSMLKRFQNNEIDVLVCSDLIARGIDLPDVRHVVSYDVPIDMAKYVHRVGRTARAGRSGDAWSLVEEQEVYHFKQMLRDAGHWDRMKTDKVPESAWEKYMQSYKHALGQLAQVYSQQRS